MTERSGGWLTARCLVVQQEWGRAHAEVAEGAERKASHGLKKIEEDFFAALWHGAAKGMEGSTMVGGSGFLRR